MWRQQDAAALWAENVFDQKGFILSENLPFQRSSISISHTHTSFAHLTSHSVTVHPHFQNQDSQRAIPPHFPRTTVEAATGRSAHQVQNEDRAEAGHATGRFSQLEAVAMGFLSCWLRISRVRDSRSRSWQVLQTNTGSYSCWSGMGSFR